MSKFDEEIALALLIKMYYQRLWKSKHIRYDTLKKCGLSKHRIGDVEKTIGLLIKSEYLVYYNRSKKALQLNWNKRREITRIIEKKVFIFSLQGLK
ncbi:MAG: hypothetical protein ISS25_02915 [Nanoarchaeota archaeon]|nr:hypothetical protein [DPANN group archaeon]MBL7116752.1 hypothetical protein [Nanoarchaeota archaeon]